MVSLTATDLIITLKKMHSRQKIKNFASFVCPCALISCTDCTHIHPLRGVDEAGHPVIDVQFHADHCDQTQKPDILHHGGPLHQLYSLNFGNANLAKDHRGPDKLMCGVCVCLCVYVRAKGGETQTNEE